MREGGIKNESSLFFNRNSVFLQDIELFVNKCKRKSIRPHNIKSKCGIVKYCSHDMVLFH